VAFRRSVCSMTTNLAADFRRSRESCQGAAGR
jgi:hypothetical protein